MIPFKYLRNYFIVYLFLATLGLHCYMQTFFSCGEWGLLSRCREQASQSGDFSCCSEWALGYADFSSCSWPALELRLSSCGTGA